MRSLGVPRRGATASFGISTFGPLRNGSYASVLTPPTSMLTDLGLQKHRVNDPWVRPGSSTLPRVTSGDGHDDLTPDSGPRPT
jgi:hypothetical protein